MCARAPKGGLCKGMRLNQGGRSVEGKTRGVRGAKRRAAPPPRVWRVAVGGSPSVASVGLSGVLRVGNTPGFFKCVRPEVALVRDDKRMGGG